MGNTEISEYKCTIWYVECLLPSSATGVNTGEVAQETAIFVEAFGALSGTDITEFNVDAGAKFKVITTQTAKALPLVARFVSGIDEVIKGHGNSPDDFFVSYSNQPHDDSEVGTQIYPVEGGTQDMSKGSELWFDSKDKNKLPIFHDLKSQFGLVAWDSDFLSNDMLFSLIANEEFRSDVVKTSAGLETRVALDKHGHPIKGAAQPAIMAGNKPFPSGLYGKMFNDDILLNEKQGCIYRVIWTLTPKL